jgi:hypothetical protein
MVFKRARLLIVAAGLSVLLALSGAISAPATASPMSDAGWGGTTYRFDRDTTRNIVAGNMAAVATRVSLPTAIVALTVGEQAAQNAVDHGQCLTMTTWGVLYAFPTWGLWSCGES